MCRFLDTVAAINTNTNMNECRCWCEYRYDNFTNKIKREKNEKYYRSIVEVKIMQRFWGFFRSIFVEYRVRILGLSGHFRIQKKVFLFSCDFDNKRMKTFKIGEIFAVKYLPSPPGTFSLLPLSPKTWSAGR